MNENPEGAAAPLTPAPEAAAPAPAPAPAAEAPAPAPAPAPAASPTTAPLDAAPVAPATAPVAPKKKKTGLIVGLVLGFLAIVGVVVALLFVFVFNKGGDPVSEAFLRLINGDERYVSISSDAEYDFMGTTFEVNLNAQIDAKAKAGTAAAKIAGSYAGTDLDIEIEARLTGNDTAFIKVSGFSDLLAGSISQLGLDCKGSECADALQEIVNAYGIKDSSVDAYISLFKIDGNWIKLDNINTSSLSLPTGISLDDVTGRKNEIVDLYKKYPFISSTTKDIKVTKKNDTIYKLSFDYDKLASFVNELSSQNVTASQLEQTIGDTSNIYVEVNDKNNLTRFYVDGAEGQSVDYAISYPTNVNVAEPDDYLDADELTPLIDMFKQYYSSFINNFLSSGTTSGGYSVTTDCDSDDVDCLVEDNWAWNWDDDED